MTNDERLALFHEIHEAIAEATAQIIERLGREGGTTLSYPPGAELSEEESAALTAHAISTDAAAGLMKVAADAVAGSFFRFFAVLDAVGDPTHYDGEWLPKTIATAPEDEDGLMLHDELFESYWSWRQHRDN